jgi:solute:Na+ symporter, SSS family
MKAIPLAPSDLVVVGGYFLLVVWVGIYFRKKIKAPADYFAGGHKVPWWLAGVSHYMSSFSAFSFVAYAQMGYTYGWVAVTLFWVTIPACVMGGLFFARAWRRANVITPVEFLERRFNVAMRQVFAWAGLPMKIFEDGLKIFATSIFLALGAGISVPWSIAVCGAVTVAYTVFGGLWALVVTDYVQFLMKALAILLLFPLALVHAGGLVKAFQGLPPEFFHITNGPYNWVYLAGFTVLITISYNGSWALAQKYYSVHTGSEASKAAYLAAALNFIGAPVMILPAVIGRHFLPDLIAQGRTADAYALLVLHLLPHGMVGIIIAAVLSATMATVSSDFNAIASVLTQDVYYRLLRPNASNQHLVRTGRVITLLLGSLVVGCGLWIYFSGDQSLFRLMVVVAGVFMAPAFLPLLAALTFPKLNWKGALTGFITGLTSGFIMLAVKAWVIPGVNLTWVRNGFDGITILVNAFFTILGMYLGTVVFGTTAADLGKAKDFFREAPPSVAAPSRGRADRPHEEPIAKMTIAVGALLGIAGLMVDSWTGRCIDWGVALFLVLMGLSLYRKSKQRDLEDSSKQAQN